MLDRKISKTQNLTFFLNDVWCTLSTNVESQITEVGGMRIHTQFLKFPLRGHMVQSVYTEPHGTVCRRNGCRSTWIHLDALIQGIIIIGENVGHSTFFVTTARQTWKENLPILYDSKIFFDTRLYVVCQEIFSEGVRPATLEVSTLRFINSFHRHVQNVTIPCRSQELLPFLSGIYPFLPPTSLPSTLTSSCHLFLGLPLSLVVSKFIYNTFLGILFSSIPCTCPNQCILFNLTVSVIVSFSTTA